MTADLAPKVESGTLIAYAHRAAGARTDRTWKDPSKPMYIDTFHIVAVAPGDRDGVIETASGGELVPICYVFTGSLSFAIYGDADEVRAMIWPDPVGG